MPRVVHFEIHASEPERTIRFYRELFGWQFNKWSGPVDYWLVVTGPREEPGIDGGLVRRQGEIDGQAVIAYVCTVDVRSVDDTMAAAKKLGARVAHDKMPVPGVGWLAYLKDPEGNIFGIMQNDPAAK
jgi:predicted enzyme related to lactoylglutathione lyase